MSIDDSAEHIMSERITRYREAACDALGNAGWEINSEDELDEALLTLSGQASRKVEVAPSDTDLIGFIDQTLYANRDSSPDVKWRNSEVLRLLEDVRRLATSQPVQVEDERIFAWEEVAKHPAFTQCYPQERPLIVSVIARLDELVSMEQAMNELAPSRLAQQVQVEVTEASVKILAKHMANAASDWNHDDCDDDDHSLEHSNWEAYTGDALRALSAALTPPPAVPAPEVIPGTRAALDGLSIRTGGGDQ